MTNFYYPFGTYVHINHVLRAVYLRWTDKAIDYSAGLTNPNITWGKPVTLKNPKLEVNPSMSRHVADTLGEDMENPLPIPKDGSTYRILQRFPCKSKGVIIGRTWRTEGRYDPGDSESPGFLSERRRTNVYQAAIDVDHGQGYAWPARICDVHPNDLFPRGIY